MCVGGGGGGGGEILESPYPDRACVRDFSKQIFRAAQPFVTKSVWNKDVGVAGGGTRTCGGGGWGWGVFCCARRQTYLVVM